MIRRSNNNNCLFIFCTPEIALQALRADGLYDLESKLE